MPKVGSVSFSYTKSGVAAAKKLAKSTGMMMKMKKMPKVKIPKVKSFLPKKKKR